MESRFILSELIDETDGTYTVQITVTGVYYPHDIG